MDEMNDSGLFSGNFEASTPNFSGKITNFEEKSLNAPENGLKSQNSMVSSTNFSKFHGQFSPSRKEYNDLLYKKIAKIRTKRNLKCSPAKKCLFDSTERIRKQELFERLIGNSLIFERILSFLSNGDLYRLSLSSSILKNAIMGLRASNLRLEEFLEKNRDNKENYRVTPPNSPPQYNDKAIDFSMAQFNQYIEIAKKLSTNQSLRKCPRCNKPSVVENSLSQCQNWRNCGYIYCLKCLSFSVDGPQNFYDCCQSSILGVHQSSTSMNDITNYSIFCSPTKKKKNENEYDSSGFYSEMESDNSVIKLNRVRRSLQSSLCPSSSSSTSGVPFRPVNNSITISSNNSNNSVTRSSDISVPMPVIPVLNSNDIFNNNDGYINIINPYPRINNNNNNLTLSPPRIKTIAICSRQSKRNLKRLTR